MKNKKVTVESMISFIKEEKNLLKPLIIKKVDNIRSEILIEAALKDDAEIFRFAVGIKSSNTPAIVQHAAFQAKERAFYDMNPLIIVPYLSPERLGELENAGVSGVDLCGNGVIIVPERIYVFRSGQPNLYPQSRPLNNPYKGRSANVARLLLIKPQFDSLKSLQKALADAGERMVISQVSKAVQALADDLVVTKKEGVIRLTDPSKLLDMLASEWKNPVIRSQQAVRLKGGINSLSALSKEPLLKWAVTGTSSVLEYTVFSESGPVMVAVTDIKSALKQVEWSPEPIKNFADAFFIETDEPGFFFASVVDKFGIRRAGIVQTFIELANGDARQQEAADDLREKILRGLANDK